MEKRLQGTSADRLVTKPFLLHAAVAKATVDEASSRSTVGAAGATTAVNRRNMSAPPRRSARASCIASRRGGAGGEFCGGGVGFAALRNSSGDKASATMRGHRRRNSPNGAAAVSRATKATQAHSSEWRAVALLASRRGARSPGRAQSIVTTSAS